MRRTDWDCLPLLEEAVEKLKQDHDGAATVVEDAGDLVFLIAGSAAWAAGVGKGGDDPTPCYSAWKRVMKLSSAGIFKLRVLVDGIACNPGAVPHLDMLLKRLQGRAGFKFLFLDSSSGRYTSYRSAPGASRVEYDVGMVTHDVNKASVVGVARGGLHFGRTVEDCLYYISPDTSSSCGGHGACYVVGVMSVPNGAVCETDGAASAASSLKMERLVWVDECAGILTGGLARSFLLDGKTATAADIAAWAEKPPESSPPAFAAALHNMVNAGAVMPWETLAAGLDKFGMYVGVFVLCVQAVEKHGFPPDDAADKQLALGAAFSRHWARTARHYHAFCRMSSMVPVLIP